jgi:hypothetical protein
MPVQNVTVKVVVTPVLIGGASLAGRRFGHQVGGWLVGLPLTSGPVAFFLATDQGVRFAAGAAVGMLAGTISQIAFALAYRYMARRGPARATLAGCVAFAVITVALSYLHWAALPTLALVVAVLAASYGLTLRHPAAVVAATATSSRWQIPGRMLIATAVVVAITALAPLLGSHLAGLLSPLPVFGAVLAIFTQHTHGPFGATAVLDGLLLGLLAPSVFFVVLALTLPTIGLIAFASATAAALATQAATVFAIPSS